jgi:acyl-CoA thioester hydrolase
LSLPLCGFDQWFIITATTGIDTGRGQKVTTTVQRSLLITHDINVGTYDIDFAGHVSNISYLRWLEDMRLKVFDVYFPLRNFLEQGITPVLASTEVQYKRPIRLFDVPRGTMWVSAMGNASLTMEAEIVVDGVVTTKAKHVGVFIDLASSKPVRIPQILRDKFQENLRG